MDWDGHNMAKVLIVEDELLIAQDVTEIVEKAGYTTTPIASTAMDAVRLATLHQPDVVLMDINLGHGSDGVEAATYIAQELALPIIFLTSLYDVGTLERAKHASPYGFLSKPVREADVVSNITMTLHQHAQKRQQLPDDDTLRGRIEMVGGMGALLEMVKTLHNQGVLRFDDDAAIHVADGKIVHVTHAQLEPETALMQLLQRGKGTFSFDPADTTEVRSLARDITSLLLNMAKDSDESARDSQAATSISAAQAVSPPKSLPETPPKTPPKSQPETPPKPPETPTLASYPFQGEVVLERYMSQHRVRGNGIVTLPDKQQVSEFKATLRPMLYVGVANQNGQMFQVEAEVRVSNISDADEPMMLECQFVSTPETVTILS